MKNYRNLRALTSSIRSESKMNINIYKYLKYKLQKGSNLKHKNFYRYQKYLETIFDKSKILVHC